MRPIPNKKAKVWQTLTKFGVTPSFILNAMKADVSESELKNSPPIFKRYTLWQLTDLIKEKTPPELLKEFYPIGLAEITARKALAKLESMHLVYTEKVEGHHRTDFSLNNKYYKQTLLHCEYLEKMWGMIDWKEGEKGG